MAFNKIMYNSSYNMKNYKSVSFRLNRKDDADIINFLASEDINMKQLFCKLIRTEMKRRNTQRGWILNTGTRDKRSNDIARFPYEIIMELPFNDHYTIGWADCYEAAEALAGWYVTTTETAGCVGIYHRSYDPDLHTVCAVKAGE